MTTLTLTCWCDKDRHRSDSWFVWIMDYSLVRLSRILPHLSAVDEDDKYYDD